MTAGSDVETASMRSCLDLVHLPPLMAQSAGIPELTLAIIDGPVLTDHPNLAAAHVEPVTRNQDISCHTGSSVACQHGTLVTSVLAAPRAGAAEGICPGCSIRVRPLFTETHTWDADVPSATPLDLASAMEESLDAGARILNLSVAVTRASASEQRALAAQLDRAARDGILVCVAAGNQGDIGSTVLTAHPWVVPVVAYDARARPMPSCNYGPSIGRRGVGAPGAVRLDSVAGEAITWTGTSVAVPFVTGTAALLWSACPTASAARVRTALTGTTARRSIIPPLLDAARAYATLLGDA